MLLKGLSRTEVNFGFTDVLVFIEGADNNIQRLTLPLQSDHQTIYHPNVLFFFVMYPGDSRDFFNEVELVKIPGTTLPVLAPVGVFNLRLASARAKASRPTHLPSPISKSTSTLATFSPGLQSRRLSLPAMYLVSWTPSTSVC